MCKHVALVPMTAEPAMQKKTCKPAMLGRMWAASRRALSLEHAPAHQFGCCQWQAQQRPPVAYLVYRWLLFIGVVSVAVASFACQRVPRQYPRVELNRAKWFIYFTNWGFLLIALQAGLALAVVHRYRSERTFNLHGEVKQVSSSSFASNSKLKMRDNAWENTASGRRPRTPLLCRGYWLAHTVATDLAFVITLVYWTLVHDPKIHEINALNLLVHGGNSLAMAAELALTAHPVRAAHALYGAGAGVAYGLFSALYWAAGGTDRLGLPAIYPALDWNKPASAFGFVALCAVVLVFAHALATCAAALRGRLAARLAARAHDRVALPDH